MSIAEINKDNIPTILRNEALLLDGKNSHDLRKAVELLAGGHVVVAPICGVMGFVCDATRTEGGEYIYELKGRDRSQQLIAAGSTITRQRLIASHKLHSSWEGFDFSTIYNLPTFVIFPAVDGLPRDFIRPDSDYTQMNTIAIWWANYYPITRQLESLLQKVKPDAFIGGSSCNRSREESIVDSRRAFEVFGRGSERVAAIIYDRDFDEGKGLIQGSHVMLKISGDKIKPYRAGSVHIDSFKPILGARLFIPEDFNNNPLSAVLDHLQIMKSGHYLKTEPPGVWRRRITRLFSFASG